jgi:hypothetical protein
MTTPHVAEHGNTKHGARSRLTKRADVARIERQVRLQNGGITVAEMTGTQRRYLRLYAEALRIVQRMEPLNADDTSNSNMAAWLAACNTAGRSLERFELAMGHTRNQRNQNELLDELARYRSGGAS